MRKILAIVKSMMDCIFLLFVYIEIVVHTQTYVLPFICTITFPFIILGGFYHHWEKSKWKLKKSEKFSQ